MNDFWKRIWTEINLDNLLCNFDIIKRHLNKDTKVCCVVKANAYGHNAPKIARVLADAGVEWFAVSNLEEALELRNAGITSSILILGYTPPECADILFHNDISQCVYSDDYAQELSNCAEHYGCRVKIHIKVDTGMGRIGFQLSDKAQATSVIGSVCKLNNFDTEGIFTHFAMSDCGEEGKKFTKDQYSSFTEIISSLEQTGVFFKIKHCANSAAAIDYPEYQMDMVRVGICLYGLSPLQNIEIPLKPVMTLKTVVSHVKKIQKGDTVSYGCDFIADREMVVATVPMGYADGFWRSNQNARTCLLIHGKKVPIIGRICMDQLMLDVSYIDNVKRGDEVTVFGDADLINTVDEIALANNTINYEIVCSVGKRVPHVFIKDRKIAGVHLGILDTTVN